QRRRQAGLGFHDAVILRVDDAVKAPRPGRHEQCEAAGALRRSSCDDVDQILAVGRPVGHDQDAGGADGLHWCPSFLSACNGTYEEGDAARCFPGNRPATTSLTFDAPAALSPEDPFRVPQSPTLGEDEMNRVDLQFAVDGDACAAWLYSPEVPAHTPVPI